MSTQCRVKMALSWLASTIKKVCGRWKVCEYMNEEQVRYVPFKQKLWRIQLHWQTWEGGENSKKGSRGEENTRHLNKRHKYDANYMLSWVTCCECDQGGGGPTMHSRHWLSSAPDLTTSICQVQGCLSAPTSSTTPASPLSSNLVQVHKAWHTTDWHTQEP